MAALFALVAAGISALFAWSLARRWKSGRKLQDLAWAISLAMYAAASLAVAAGASQGWDFTTYRFFWLFGAVLTVPWLALGSIALASTTMPAGRLVRAVATGVVIALHPVAIWATFAQRLRLEPFLGTEGLTSDAVPPMRKIPRGAEVWGDAVALPLARYASIIGWVIVIGIAVWTSRSRDGMRPPPWRVRANVLIALGVTIVAIGGFALGRVGEGEAFSAALAIGVAVMYVGFVMAGRAPRYAVESPGDSPT